MVSDIDQFEQLESEVSRITQSVQGMFKNDYQNKFGKIKNLRFFEVFALGSIRSLRGRTDHVPLGIESDSENAF